MLPLMLTVPDVIIVSWYRGARGQRCVSGTELMIIVIVLTLGGAFFRLAAAIRASTPSMLSKETPSADSTLMR